jgi:hypothetical protein
VVKEFPHVIIKNALALRLTSSPGSKNEPVICGVELISEAITAESGQR